MVDTNSDPRPIDFIVPSNDDASKSIEVIMASVTAAIAEGLTERKSEKQTEKEGEEETKPKEKKAKVASEEKDSKKSSSTGDDLTKIEGIGPKIAEIFQEAGINTYADLADRSEDDLKDILAESGPRYASKNPASWPKQAQMAADGNWDELQEWQDNVKGGIE
jgi:small subunit ribosomal protein S2